MIKSRVFTFKETVRHTGEVWRSDRHVISSKESERETRTVGRA